MRFIPWNDMQIWQPGPGCSKLTTSWVKVSLKFQTLITEILHLFLFYLFINFYLFIYFFFFEKEWEAFALQKLLTFFQQKYQYIW